MFAPQVAAYIDQMLAAVPPDAADFAITARGVFTIRRGDQVVQLTAAEFAEMRQFVDRACPIWESRDDVDPG